MPITQDWRQEVKLFGLDPNGNPIQLKATTDGYLMLDLEQSAIQLPINIQSRLAQTIQTHNAVNIAASGNTSSSWFDCDGFDRVGITLLNDSGTAQNSLAIRWSNDGTNVHGYESILNAAAQNQRSAISDIKTRYIQIVAYNNDSAAAHTMSAWIYLKA